MNLATEMGRLSGRATPSLQDDPSRQNNETGRRSTYLLPIAVQTNRATSQHPRACLSKLQTFLSPLNLGITSVSAGLSVWRLSIVSVGPIGRGENYRELEDSRIFAESSNMPR